jgi:hypothetical protein
MGALADGPRGCRCPEPIIIGRAKQKKKLLIIHPR